MSRAKTLPETVREVRKEALTAALQAAAGNVSEAARALGIARSYVKTLVVRFELRSLIDALRADAGVSNKGGRPWPRSIEGKK